MTVFHTTKGSNWLGLLGVLAVFLSLAAGCAAPQTGSQSQLKGTITASGAFALYPMMVKWGEEFTRRHPDVQFDISAGGAGKGMADALAGAADIGMVSREISADEEGKGAWWVAVTKDAVLPMVNASNPVLADLMTKGVTKDQFIGIYITGEIKTWGQLIDRPEVTDSINVYTRSDAAGAPETWAKYLGNKKQENLLGIGVFGDPGLLEAVVKDKLGIGFNNVAYAFDATTGKPVTGVAAIPLDANGNGPADARRAGGGWARYRWFQSPSRGSDAGVSGGNILKTRPLGFRNPKGLSVTRLIVPSSGQM